MTPNRSTTQSNLKELVDKVATACGGGLPAPYNTVAKTLGSAEIIVGDPRERILIESDPHASEVIAIRIKGDKEAEASYLLDSVIGPILKKAGVAESHGRVARVHSQKDGEYHEIVFSIPYSRLQEFDNKIKDVSHRLSRVSQLETQHRAGETFIANYASKIHGLDSRLALNIPDSRDQLPRFYVVIRGVSDDSALKNDLTNILRNDQESVAVAAAHRNGHSEHSVFAIPLGSRLGVEAFKEIRSRVPGVAVLRRTGDSTQLAGL